MLTFRQLQARLCVNQPTLSRLVRDGLPWHGKRRAKRFDADEVDRWLVDHGLAERVEEEQIARTYQELVDALGLGGVDPIRVVAGWAKRPDFPGRVGSPGPKRDAVFPVEKIRAWVAEQRLGSNGHGGDEQLLQLRLERERLRLEREIREEMLAAERLADVDDVARFNRQIVANTKAVLEPMADEVCALLPPRPPAARNWRTFRAQIHSLVTELLDNAYGEIERIVVGDDDETDDSED